MHGTLSDQSLIYLQIAQMLEDDILRGRLPGGGAGALHQ